jgi:hypothetical protein
VNETYDFVVIGAGSAGLSSAGFAAELGAHVALVEKHRIGGGCTWTGCVPSKTLIKASRVTHHVRSADQYGVIAAEPVVDLAPVMAHVRRVIGEIYEEENPEALRAKSIDVYLGTPRFLDPRTLAADGQTLKARNVVLAVGAQWTTGCAPASAASMPQATASAATCLSTVPGGRASPPLATRSSQAQRGAPVTGSPGRLLPSRRWPTPGLPSSRPARSGGTGWERWNGRWYSLIGRRQNWIRRDSSTWSWVRKERSWA